MDLLPAALSPPLRHGVYPPKVDHASERGPGPVRFGGVGPGLSWSLRQNTAEAHRTLRRPCVSLRPPRCVGIPGCAQRLADLYTAGAEFSRITVARELGPNVALLSRTQALRADIRLMLARCHPRPMRSALFRAGLSLRITMRRSRGEDRGGVRRAGSVLGGRVIAANLAASGCCDFPRSFFASDRLDLGRLWRHFKTALDVSANPGRTPPVSRGAHWLLHVDPGILSGPDASPGAI